MINYRKKHCAYPYYLPSAVIVCCDLEVPTSQAHYTKDFLNSVLRKASLAIKPFLSISPSAAVQAIYIYLPSKLLACSIFRMIFSPVLPV